MNKKSGTIQYHLMLLPGMIFLLIYNIIPIFGSIIAFENYIPTKGIFGSKWVGLENFEYMFQLADIKQIFFNTVFIACTKIVLNMLFAILFAILLNEISSKLFSRSIQTIVYLPHFLSWVILASIFIDLASSDGIINKALLGLHFIKEPILFLINKTAFPWLLIFSDVWKEFGFSAVIFLAALTSVSPTLYEAAYVDGANRLKRIWYVTLPGIAPIIILLATLNLGNVLNADFTQVYNMYNPLVYQTGDIIDTYVYRAGLINYQFSFATAVGTLKSIISFVLMVIAYKLADKFADYRIF
jgi:putative aldouronate transport system permease protein